MNYCEHEKVENKTKYIVCSFFKIRLLIIFTDKINVEQYDVSTSFMQGLSYVGINNIIISKQKLNSSTKLHIVISLARVKIK